MSAFRFVSTTSLLAAALFAIDDRPRADAAETFLVRFRLTNARASHFDDARTAEQFSRGLQQIGCEVETRSHGNHLDVVYRCPQWKTIEASSDESAHRWEAWLRKQGFETSHQH